MAKIYRNVKSRIDQSQKVFIEIRKGFRLLWTLGQQVHMHAHLIWNSVSFVTGQKYNSPKGNWKNKLQPITNKYCEKLGLAICPAEYSKNPVNMTRDEWQKEQDFKEFILRDAKFCALSAGSVEHFEFLMKRLGYEFQSGAYMRVRIPGRKIYHRLDKMDEMFEEGKLKYYVEMPWSANPYFYSQKPGRFYRSGMTAYQKKYYAKMYRMWGRIRGSRITGVPD
jgi:hypothetical protein